jgi:hypothetical protein
MKLTNIKYGVLNTQECDKTKLHLMHRAGQIVLICVALFALSACSDSQAMEKCQQTHSYDTCVYTLR